MGGGERSHSQFQFTRFVQDLVFRQERNFASLDTDTFLEVYTNLVGREHAEFEQEVDVPPLIGTAVNEHGI